MIADTERLGLYDADPEAVKAALKAARKNRDQVRVRSHTG
jgi:hypothetical protein